MNTLALTHEMIELLPLFPHFVGTSSLKRLLYNYCTCGCVDVYRCGTGNIQLEVIVILPRETRLAYSYEVGMGRQLEVNVWSCFGGF